MRELVIRYLPKMLDRELFQIYVPVKDKRLVAFNFFDKQSAFKFAESIVDGAFTGEEAESLLKVPILPDKPKRERAIRQDSLPLAERDINAWTAKRRNNHVIAVLRDAGDSGITSGDVYQSAKRQGDPTSQGTYQSILKRLARQEIAREDRNASPMKYYLLPDVNFRNSVLVENRPPTHSMLRKAAHTRED